MSTEFEPLKFIARDEREIIFLIEKKCDLKNYFGLEIPYNYPSQHTFTEIQFLQYYNKYKISDGGDNFQQIINNHGTTCGITVVARPEFIFFLKLKRIWPL